MTRVLSALVLLPVVLLVVVGLPSWGTLGLAAVILVLSMVEYVRLAEQRSPRLPRTLMTVGALVVLVAMALPGVPVAAPLLAVAVAMGAACVGAGRPDDDVLRRVAVAAFPVLYLGLPLGALAAVRDRWGAEVLLLLVLMVMASDVAQYYGGRAFGRRLLAPTISPKKTVEGAVSGFVAGAAVLPALGAWWLPGLHPAALALVGVTLVALGIVGDLFESLLKRSAGVKDSSGLIPGHGGMLDRIDSLLFAGPVYYLVLAAFGV